MLPQDRLVRKEVALGLIREFELPQNHIGLSTFAPFQSVESDDVIFEYTQGLVAGLAPARAEDSESELARKDATLGEGRASIIDWAEKDHYSPSDISRYREGIWLRGNIGGSDQAPHTENMVASFEQRVARDTLIRRRKLDNRLEWLIMEALWNGEIVYNDGKIKFTADFQRPTLQNAGTLPSGPSVVAFTDPDSDPVGNILEVQEYGEDTLNVNWRRAVTSKKVIRSFVNSEKFQNTLIGSNPLYTVPGWGWEAAQEVVMRACNIDELIVYDSVYRTKPLGSNTVTSNRFSPEDSILFLPSSADVNEIDDAIGFGKTLTSPHPEGNWTAGYYEWEKDTGPDPWGHDVGAGVKAFPVFPHLDLTYVLRVLNLG